MKVLDAYKSRTRKWHHASSTLALQGIVPFQRSNVPTIDINLAISHYPIAGHFVTIRRLLEVGYVSECQCGCVDALSVILIIAFQPSNKSAIPSHPTARVPLAPEQVPRVRVRFF